MNPGFPPPFLVTRLSRGRVADLDLRPLSKYSAKSSGFANSGFTLTEMLIVVAILGILATIALPSFRSLSQSQRIKNASYDLYSALSLTRNEAIKRNQDVTLSTVWNAKNEMGWTISTSGVPSIRTKTYISGVGISITGLMSPAQVIYHRNGRTTYATFQIDAAGVTTPTPFERCITLELSGMPHIKQGGCP